MTLRNEYLRAHQIDAGDHLGDRVLDLNAWIYFDEVPLAESTSKRNSTVPALR